MCVPCQLSEYIFPHFLPLSSNRNSHAQGHVRLIPCEIKINYERSHPDPMYINLKIPTAKKQYKLKVAVSRDFLKMFFFRELNPPGPLINRLKSFCWKIRFRGDIRILSSKNPTQRWVGQFGISTNLICWLRAACQESPISRISPRKRISLKNYFNLFIMGPGGFDSLNLKNAKNSRDTATLTILKRKYECNTLKS